MDLLQTVRKEGSRGGVNFSWDDVKNSNHRENYLGHSLMAPVGRWQKNKDLSWYAKADDAELTPEEKADKEREAKRAELRKVKEAEEDAMARALGLPVPERKSEVNETPLGMDRTRQAEVNKALKEALDDDQEDRGNGVGFGAYSGGKGDNETEVLKGSRSRDEDRSGDRRKDRRDDEYRTSKRRRRSRSRSNDRERDEKRRHRHRSERSRSRSMQGRRRIRSGDRRSSNEFERRRRDRNGRSRSPEKEYRRRRNRSRSRSRSPQNERQRRRDRSR